MWLELRVLRATKWRKVELPMSRGSRVIEDNIKEKFIGLRRAHALNLQNLKKTCQAHGSWLQNCANPKSLQWIVFPQPWLEISLIKIKMMMMMKNPPWSYINHMLESDGVKRRALRARRLERPPIKKQNKTYALKRLKMHRLLTRYLHFEINNAL